MADDLQASQTAQGFHFGFALKEDFQHRQIDGSSPQGVDFVLAFAGSLLSCGFMRLLRSTHVPQPD